jgi:hypothetical protein
VNARNRTRPSTSAPHEASGLAIVGLVVLENIPTFRKQFLALMFAGLAGGCYSNAFDEALPNVYYCIDHGDCLSSQACSQFTCVDDSGPELTLGLPEPLTIFTIDELIVDFDATNLVLSDANHFAEGEGKVRISIDGVVVVETFSDAGEVLDISGLAPGAHRIELQAIHGDGTPYSNPSAYTYTSFFVQSDNAMRPLVAIMYPPPGQLHPIDEPLQLRVAVRNFNLVDAGTDCKVPTDCDPFDPLAVDCIPACNEPPSGHVHVYIIPDYPDCLQDTPIGCNGDYVLSMRTNEVEGNEVTGELPVDTFDATGATTLSVALQYNDHDPFPAKSFIIYDSIEVHVTE